MTPNTFTSAQIKKLKILRMAIGYKIVNWLIVSKTNFLVTYLFISNKLYSCVQEYSRYVFINPLKFMRTDFKKARKNSYVIHMLRMNMH